MLVEMPFNGYRQLRTYVQMQAALVDKAATLHIENLLLKGKLQKFTALEVENDRLRQLLNSTAEIKDKLFVANILSIDPDPFTHQITLNKGKVHGVTLGQPILNANGIMGTVVGVDEYTSRVLLITDASFAIPVENTRNGISAIAVGTGARDRLELQHVPNTVDVEVGDLLVTSGFGGHYPFGYPVGVVVDLQRDPSQSFASIHIKPKADLTAGREILLIQLQHQAIEQEK